MCCIKKKNDKNVSLNSFLFFYRCIFYDKKSHDSLKDREERWLYFKYHWNSFGLPDFEINGRKTFDRFFFFFLKPSNLLTGYFITIFEERTSMTIRAVVSLSHYA